MTNVISKLSTLQQIGRSQTDLENSHQYLQLDQNEEKGETKNKY